jgi:hypothetical protein
MMNGRPASAIEADPQRVRVVRRHVSIASLLWPERLTTGATEIAAKKPLKLEADTPHKRN